MLAAALEGYVSHKPEPPFWDPGNIVEMKSKVVETNTWIVKDEDNYNMYVDNKVIKIFTSSWYRPHMSHSRATAWLLNPKLSIEGNFVIRKPKRGCNVLLVRHCDQIKHIKIRRDMDGYYYVRDSSAFYDLCELVLFYTHNRLFQGIKLKHRWNFAFKAQVYFDTIGPWGNPGILDLMEGDMVVVVDWSGPKWYCEFEGVGGWINPGQLFVDARTVRALDLHHTNDCVYGHWKCRSEDDMYLPTPAEKEGYVCLVPAPPYSHNNSYIVPEETIYNDGEFIEGDTRGDGHVAVIPELYRRIFGSPLPLDESKI